jgi:predicted O-linked N-acetylglucosamine transferase (SPINDLY family)
MVFARRPAPIQVNYLGYASTMGASFFDYIIADRIILPDEDRQNYSEQVVWLPGSYMRTDRHRTIAQRTPTRAECGLPEAGFVFCCFNNPFKITPQVFDIWIRLLDVVDGSVLWLSSASAIAMENLRREAERRGVARERLVFAPRLLDIADHLAGEACRQSREFAVVRHEAFRAAYRGCV